MMSNPSPAPLQSLVCLQLRGSLLPLSWALAHLKSVDGTVQKDFLEEEGFEAGRQVLGESFWFGR